MKPTLLIFLFSLFSTTALAQIGDDPMDTVYSYNQKNKAKLAVLNHLRLEDGSYVYFCRGEYAPMGCESRVQTLVNIVFREARRNNLDPWLLLGLAIETSNFNPFNIDNNVASGLMGVPHDSSYRRSEEFFLNSDFRVNCRNVPDACQESIIANSARLIREGIDNCPETRNGFQRYETGSCNGNSQFARHVYRWARNLRRFAGTIEDIDVCEIHPLMCEDVLHGIEIDL